MSLPRVLFDTNTGTFDHGYWLDFDQSLRELNAIPGGPQTGLCVVIYMPGELEMQAILKHDEKSGVWLGVPVSGTIVYLDGSA